MGKSLQKILLVLVILAALGLVAISLPPVRDRLTWHLDQWRTRIVYFLRPPEKEIFVPQAEVATAVQATMAQFTPSLDPTETSTSTPDVPEDTPTPTFTPTPLPESVKLEGVRYIDQHYGWNNCGPANLAMALTYWGWNGKAQDTSAYLKPFEQDKNVMPYEMVNYVEEKTDLAATLRYGGTLKLLKNLLANHYPVLIEIGTFRIRETLTGKYSWMGHYQVLTGYDDASQEFILQDSYFPDGKDYHLVYETLLPEWRSFDFVFLVIYPKDREQAVLSLLGDYADATTADRIAYQTASDEIYKLSGTDLFFAWFNRGSSLVRLQDYNGAAQAFDEAYRLMAELSEDKRPYRITWYQTSPYFAYFYTGRYQDVIKLANSILDPLELTQKPYLEESYYWRGQAKYALGDVAGGIEDVKKSLEYHPGFQPALDLLNQWGVNP